MYELSVKEERVVREGVRGEKQMTNDIIVQIAVITSLVIGLGLAIVGTRARGGR